MKKNKNVLIVGSGFSGLACCLRLIQFKIKPTIVDYKNDNKKNISIFDLSSQKNDFFNLGNYQGLGGQSNVWAGIVNKYSNTELSKIFLKSNLTNFYEEKILSKLNMSILENNSNVLTLIDKSNSKTAKLNKIYKKMIKEKKINFISNKINKISKIKNKVRVEINQKSYDFDYIFLCCGPKSIIKLLPEYHSSSSKIIFSQKYLIPALITGNNKLKNYNFPIAQYSLKEKNKNLIYVQIYSLGQILDKYFKIKIFNKIKILSKIGLVYLSASSDLSDYIFIHNQKIVKKSSFNLIKNLSTKLFVQKKFSSQFKILNLYIKLGALAGNHYGGNLPIKNKESKGNVNLLCQPYKTKNISILGTSVFKYIPALPPTLTIFFFSYFKTKEIIKKLF